MARIKFYNKETGRWEYADMAVSGGSGGSVSWNDLTDKPFGEGSVSLDMLAFMAENNAESQSGQVAEGKTMFVYGCRTTPDKFSLEIGKEYTVTINGNTYTGVAVDFSEVLGEGAVALGDTEAVKNEDITNLRYAVMCANTTMNGEPDGGYQVNLYYVGAEIELTECTLTSEGVKTLDEKYIPNTIARTADVERMIEVYLSAIPNAAEVGH